MRFSLPKLDTKYQFVDDTYVRLRFDWASNYWRNLHFYSVHSGWKAANPTAIFPFSTSDLYGKQNIFNDHISKYVQLKITAGTIVKITKLALGRNTGKKFANLSITKTDNKHTQWGLPTLYLSLPIEEFEFLNLEEVLK